jgi:phosphatidylserine/phosphatidylglycerophosphate/cardiolipin synthase-like enzyme
MNATPDLDFLQPGRNCWALERADRARVIVDAADYFHTIREAMLKAREQILLIGWDFDTRIPLDRPARRKGAPPVRLGKFLLWLAENRPDLKIYILKWDLGALKLLGRGRSIIDAARWALHERITFKLDHAHPAGCSHHQKIVVIDDSLAVCGGIDMTADRWDTPEHLDDDPRRKRPNGKLYGPWHDTTMVVTGPIARRLGDLGRDRWELASGERPPQPSGGSDLWPDELEPIFTDVELAIARTRAAYEDRPAVNEIETLFIDQIAAARRFIYAENQYFASRRIAEAIAARMAEPDPPEIVLVGPLRADGWLEQVAMDATRVRLVRAIGAKDTQNRFRVYSPVTAKGEAIYVHAKLTIVDDIILRVGSANMNNRSMGLDSECDLVLDCRLPENATSCDAIGELRRRLLAEHLGVELETLSAHLAQTGSMIETIAALGGDGRSLRPLDVTAPDATETFIADNELLDPESPEGFFEPLATRSLFKRRKLLKPA